MNKQMARWLRGSALLGGIAWVALFVAPLDPRFGLGTIEKLFLFSPLVIVPLGLALTQPRNGLERVMARLQPFAAALVVVSFFLETGRVAGMLVIPWLVVTLLAALAGLRWLLGGAFRSVEELCYADALLMLAVGGIGLLQSRWGMTPLGFREPLILLVAVHFHYAAFVSPLVSGATARVLDRASRTACTLYWAIAVSVIAGSPCLAWGYVLHVASLRLTGATLLVVGLFGVSLTILRRLRMVHPPCARRLLGIAAITVLAAMAYASVYAIADYFGEVWIAIPQMARTHGYLNAFGFSLCGLCGWLLAARKKEAKDDVARA